MTISIDSRLDSLRSALQAQAERHTEELTQLTQHGGDPERNGLDRQTIAALADSARQGLAETTEALKRMAEGTYGRCQHCGGQIPVARLEILPHARFCVSCRQTQGG
jgi:RNA polymerase-binding transcription factor DksA